MYYRIIRALALVGLLAGLLAGCGGSAQPAQPAGGSAPNAATTPEQIHSAWVEGIRNNNRDALLALAADMEYKATFVDDNLKSLQDKLTAAKDGKLLSVDVRAPTDEGAGRLGISVWRFEKRPVCYGTTMAASNGVWKVTEWGIVVAKCKGIT